MNLTDRRSKLLLAAVVAMSGAIGAQARVPGAHGNIDNYTDASTCLMCHSGVATDVMASVHWTWEHTDEITGQQMGKNNVINNYCIAVPSNEPRCTSCHIGVGYKDDTFDFSDSSLIDCLICHDTTGTYSKVPTGAGAPPAELDLTAIAQKAGTPSRNNCGSCHFYGGGGDAVKHGSLDSTMADPSRDLDVHMGGMGFQCQSCHVPDADEPHAIVGSRYSQAQPDNNLCISCHTAQPSGHTTIQNNHTSRVACQTCHIPAYARGGKATKMWWDWSTAGQKNGDGTPIVTKDADGNVIYDTKKGSFVWKENVIPEYVWFNGTVRYVEADDLMDPDAVNPINVLEGSIDDTNAYIFPVKRFKGIQPYDAGAGTLAIPHLFGSDENAYWKSYDWTKSLTAGQAAVGRTFVGPVGYVETEMLWIQNHMVAPKEQSLQCADCHTFGSRINFAALGYAEERANQLQLMAQEDWWAGFPVHSDGHSVYTADWMGWIDITNEPWVYSYMLGGYVYVSETMVSSSGSWIYVPN